MRSAPARYPSSAAAIAVPAAVAAAAEQALAGQFAHGAGAELAGVLVAAAGVQPQGREQAHHDQHHAGHVHASVRYSIRSPLPICVRDSVFPGFIDLRLMRQSGDPYSREDLVTAIAYTEALQFIYQSLMNFVLKENKNFVFAFGDKKWIEKVCLPQTPEMVAAIA